MIMTSQEYQEVIGAQVHRYYERSDDIRLKARVCMRMWHLYKLEAMEANVH